MDDEPILLARSSTVFVEACISLSGIELLHIECREERVFGDSLSTEIAALLKAGDAVFEEEKHLPYLGNLRPPPDLSVVFRTKRKSDSGSWRNQLYGSTMLLRLALENPIHTAEYGGWIPTQGWSYKVWKKNHGAL